MTGREQASRPREPRPGPSPAGDRVDAGSPATMTAVRVTRARHPLAGAALPVLGRMRRHGRVELLLVLPDGSKSLVPEAWTDSVDAAGNTAAGGDPVAATLGSPADLLHATALVGVLTARVRREAEQAARQSPCEEDNRAARAAQSDAGAGAGATKDPARPASEPRIAAAIATLAGLIARVAEAPAAAEPAQEAGDE